MNYEEKYDNFRPDILYRIPISETWWGQQWCKNLDRYSDDKNRLSRARSYTRQGRIQKITIKPNKINATIRGRFPEPYEISIEFKPLSKNKYEKVIKKLSNSIDDVNTLISAEFPENYKEFLSDVDIGLFPTLKELKLSCSCPDEVDVCKHISASLYEVGTILDTDPLLLFYLRGINIDEFLKQIIRTQEEKINSITKSKRTIDENRINSLFGIEDFVEDEYSPEKTVNNSSANQSDKNIKKEIVEPLDNELTRKEKIKKDQLLDEEVEKNKKENIIITQDNINSKDRMITEQTNNKDKEEKLISRIIDFFMK